MAYPSGEDKAPTMALTQQRQYIPPLPTWGVWHTAGAKAAGARPRIPVMLGLLQDAAAAAAAARPNKSRTGAHRGCCMGPRAATAAAGSPWVLRPTLLLLLVVLMP